MTRLFNQDNWYKWFYTDNGKDSLPFSRRVSVSEKLKTSYGKLPKFMAFKEAVLNNAKSTIDAFPNEKFNLLVSGGIDSELMLRAYKSLRHPFHSHIFRYENDYNIYDVSHAVLLCENLDVPYTVHNFSLSNFFSNNFVEYSDAAQSDRPRALVQLAFPEIIGDGLIVSASSDPRWYRPHEDYSVKTLWRVQDFEHDLAMDRYTEYKNIPSIMQWFKWTPELTLAWFSLKWFSKLVADEIPGKLGVTSTKIQGYREVYADMPFRLKKTGFESIDYLVIPAVSFLKEKNKGLHYRQTVDRSANDLWQEMVGRDYYTDFV